MNTTGGGGNMARNLQILQNQSLQVTFNLTGTGYEAIENIGTGAYGVVCSAMHTETRQKVAIKKIPDIFSMHPAYALRTYREIRILRHFRHDNIIAIREILQPSSESRVFKDVYVVLDLMESDLHRIIYSKQQLSDEHVRYFLYQILRGLKYVHSANVIHRDLKPSNLLVNENCDLKIGDFGMARGLDLSRHADDRSNMMLTQYVATRWYRAPELIVSYKAYGAKIDVWSVGCIFAELLRRKYLFPGKDLLNQLSLIIGTLGSPSKEFVESLGSETSQAIINKMGQKEAKPWDELCPGAPRHAIDLISQMLVIDPSKRISVTAALRHPYLAKYHDPDDEPLCMPPFNFDFEVELEAISNADSKKDRLREKIYDEILALRRPQPTPSATAFVPFSYFDLGGPVQRGGGGGDSSTIDSGGRAGRERSVYEELGDFLTQLAGPPERIVGQPSPPRRHSSDRVFSVADVSKANSLPKSDAFLPHAAAFFSDISTLFDNPLLAANILELSPSDNPKGDSALDSDEKLPAGSSLSTPGVARSGSHIAGRAKEDDRALSKSRTGEDAGEATRARNTLESVPSDVSMPSATLKISNNKGIRGPDSDWPPAGPQDEREDRRAEAKDAKALLREALLKSQRSKVDGAAYVLPQQPKDERKATTAYQRQKEREEKRKLKLEKAKQKKKKCEQQASADGSLLTKEDIEMLERWKKMQQPGTVVPSIRINDVASELLTSSVGDVHAMSSASDRLLGSSVGAPAAASRGGMTVVKTGNVIIVQPPASFNNRQPMTSSYFLPPSTMAITTAVAPVGRPMPQYPAAGGTSQLRFAPELDRKYLRNELSTVMLPRVQSSTADGVTSAGTSIWTANGRVDGGFTEARDDKELASITTKFSKQQMDDSLPPVLTMTPRGTGCGYGVGYDMESMLGEAFYAEQPQSATMDSAPLSASLMADWMDITANVGPIDLDEALQQELELSSPLTDFSLAASHVRDELSY